MLSMASSFLLHPTIAIPTSDSNSSSFLLQPLQSSRYLITFLKNHRRRTTTRIVADFRIRASNGDNNGDSFSYLNMWKQAVNREKKDVEFQKISQNLTPIVDDETTERLKKKNNEFQKILEVSREERDRVQRMQVIDRAAAAIAAARALLKDKNAAANAQAASSPSPRVESDYKGRLSSDSDNGDSRSLYNRQSRISVDGPPGPDFWSWTPPPEGDSSQSGFSNTEEAAKTSEKSYPPIEVVVKERFTDSFSIPLESTYSESNLIPPLPPFQSLMEVQNVEAPDNSQEAPVMIEIDSQFSAHAAEAAHALHNVEEKPSHGINPDGSRWWKETGMERRSDGVVCRWTLNRGVSANGVVEWEDKYWEAADEFDFKELGSEKSGRDAFGNVWHECWKESMWQEHGLLHMEKIADKWGRNAKDEEWQEKWLEHYDASGKADKWAHKWCSIDPNTQVEAGHAHVWHERWGEKYDGQGGSIKYTDKWAERCEGDAWVKWGDKWDENFDLNGRGVKQGETWWEGKYGDRWNRTWGEQHNGSGWLHKYGKSSCGEHWDTHVQEDTWYERYPHFGFMHCYENSVQLRKVQKPSVK